MGRGRIELLEKIDACGSISQAAKAMKMSYKAAWDAVDAMNNIAGEALVTSASGGKGGGGTRLTAKGRKLVAMFQIVEREHMRFLERLGQGVEDFDNFYSLLRKLAMKTSARNQFFGRITALRAGTVSVEVEIRLGGEDRIVATITQESLENLGLAVGGEAFALIKAPWVILTGGDAPGIKFSARNRLCGAVDKITRGEVNSDIVLRLDSGLTLSSVMTNESLDHLELSVGGRTCAIFTSSSVIIGIGIGA
ncbi:MAG TPA: molybdenum-dependent transcriptional regulator [Betaproteobacteria bacterium]|nr:molybdenum-dependent transcriptional regulator [Betaproteobacteria bacterium]